MYGDSPCPIQVPRLVRSWPELLPACVLLEEYRLPAHFVMSPHEHESGHGWLIIEGGFEQHTQDGVVWRYPGELQAYGGRAVHQIRTGDRGGSCLVFENVLRSSDYSKRHDHRATQEIADALQPLLAGGGDIERAREVFTSLLNPIQARRPQRAEPAWVQDVDVYIATHFRVRFSSTQRLFKKHSGTSATMDK